MKIVIIISDTLRSDYLGCYGNNWVKTPYLDSLANSSTLFERAYTGSFPTMPMRADLMRGKYCFQSFGWAPLPEKETILQSILRLYGYVNCMITDHTQMLAPGYNYHQGFDGVHWIRGQGTDPWITDPIDVELPCSEKKLRFDYKQIKKYLQNISVRKEEADWFSPQTMQKSADWIRKNCKHEDFLLYVDTFDVHEPWTPPQHYVDLYNPGYNGEVVIYPRYDRTGYMSDEELKHVRAIYAATITMMDKWIGKLFNAIKETGIWDETLIIFTADHGWYFGEHSYIGKHTVIEPGRGWPFYEEVAHIPLIMKLPGQDSAFRTQALAQPVDILPTILELAGISLPPGLHGVSQMPVLQKKTDSVREIAVTSGRLPDERAVLAYSSVTNPEWSLIEGGKNIEPELYNLKKDPHQKQDVYTEHPETAQKLHSEYMKFLKSIGTPENRLRLREYRTG